MVLVVSVAKKFFLSASFPATCDFENPILLSNRNLRCADAMRGVLRASQYGMSGDEFDGSRWILWFGG